MEARIKETFQMHRAFSFEENVLPHNDSGFTVCRRTPDKNFYKSVLSLYIKFCKKR